MDNKYQFRKVNSGDLPLLKTWLAKNHVKKWWGNPEEEFNTIKKDVDDFRVHQWMVSVNDVPFAYIQDYSVHDWDQDALSHYPKGSRGIDIFIGCEDMLGQGHGTAIVKKLTGDLIETGTPQVIIDPDPENNAAIRAYEKAGFKTVGKVRLDGDMALLMEYIG